MPKHNHTATFTVNRSDPVTGALYAYNSGALTDTPDAGSFISGGGARYFSATGAVRRA